jgi:hypothetical protein
VEKRIRSGGGTVGGRLGDGETALRLGKAAANPRRRYWGILVKIQMRRRRKTTLFQVLYH